MAGEERGVEQGLRGAASRVEGSEPPSVAFFYLMCLVLDESVKTVLRPLLFNCFKNYGV
jgi:hypothetical protein